MILEHYSRAARHATQSVVSQPVAIAGIMALHVIFVIAALTFQFLGLREIGSILSSFLFLIFLTIGYGVCETIHQRQAKIRIEDFRHFDWSLFSSLINVGFILWLLKFTLQYVIPTSSSWISIGCSILALLALNPSPEIAILKRLDGLSAITYSIDFMKQRTVEWLIPVFILLSPIFYFEGIKMFIAHSAGADVLFPASLLLSGIDLLIPSTSSTLLDYLILAVTHSVIGLWLMLFRLSLFEQLSQSSRRLYDA